MEPDGSLPHSQGPAAFTYPEPAWSRPYPHIPPPTDPSVKWMPNYTHLKNTHKHNNEGVDVLSDYPVHWLPNDTHQLHAHPPPCKYTCVTRRH